MLMWIWIIYQVTVREYRKPVYSHILREVSALLVLLQWAFQSLEKRDERQSIGSHAFFVLPNVFEASPTDRPKFFMALKQYIRSLGLSILSLGALVSSSCSSKSFPVSFICDDPTAEIYVDGNYIGSGGPISYTVPAGAKRVHVDCIVDGETIYSRNYNVEGQKNTLFDIRVPQNMQYHTN